jgi:hypothetical protein
MLTYAASEGCADAFGLLLCSTEAEMMHALIRTHNPEDVAMTRRQEKQEEEARKRQEKGRKRRKKEEEEEEED